MIYVHIKIFLILKLSPKSVLPQIYPLYLRRQGRYQAFWNIGYNNMAALSGSIRSEERRVGKDCRRWWGACTYNENNVKCSEKSIQSMWYTILMYELM